MIDTEVKDMEHTEIPEVGHGLTEGVHQEADTVSFLCNEGFRLATVRRSSSRHMSGRTSVDWRAVAGGSEGLQNAALTLYLTQTSDTIPGGKGSDSGVKRGHRN